MTNTSNDYLNQLTTAMKLTQRKIATAVSILEMSDETYLAKFSGVSNSNGNGTKRGRKAGSKNKKTSAAAVTTATAPTSSVTTNTAGATPTAEITNGPSKRSVAAKARWARLKAIEDGTPAVA